MTNIPAKLVEEKKMEEMSREIESLREKYFQWMKKIDELKNEIKALEELQTNPIINASTLSIGVFLLKSQIIEFELKQAIVALDREINAKLDECESDANRRVRSPKELNKMTMGTIVNIFCEFDGLIPKDLKKDLKKLKDLRNNFTHNLFDQEETIDDLRNDARSGISVSNVVLEYLEKMRDELKKRDIARLRKMMSDRRAKFKKEHAQENEE